MNVRLKRAKELASYAVQRVGDGECTAVETRGIACIAFQSVGIGEIDANGNKLLTAVVAGLEQLGVGTIETNDCRVAVAVTID